MYLLSTEILSLAIRLFTSSMVKDSDPFKSKSLKIFLTVVGIGRHICGVQSCGPIVVRFFAAHHLLALLVLDEGSLEVFLSQFVLEL